MYTLAFVLILSLVSSYAISDEQITVNTIKIVAGKSMQPTLQPNDVVKLIKASPDELQQGDLIAIKFKKRENLMVKRVIAKAGDNVNFSQNRLVINDKTFEKRINLNKNEYKLLSLQLSHFDNQIPAGSVIVMGDGNNSFDSGDYGLVSHSQIVGKIEKDHGGTTQ